MPIIAKSKQRVLDAFELRTDEWTVGDLEKAMIESMGWRGKTYKDARSAMLEAKSIGRWPLTVARYFQQLDAMFSS